MEYRYINNSDLSNFDLPEDIAAIFKNLPIKLFTAIDKHESKKKDLHVPFEVMRYIDSLARNIKAEWDVPFSTPLKSLKIIRKGKN